MLVESVLAFPVVATRQDEKRSAIRTQGGGNGLTEGDVPPPGHSRIKGCQNRTRCGVRCDRQPVGKPDRIAGERRHCEADGQHSKKAKSRDWFEFHRHTLRPKSFNSVNSSLRGGKSCFSMLRPIHPEIGRSTER